MIVFGETVIAELSFSSTSVCCTRMLRLFNMTGFWHFVLPWTWWQCVIFIEALLLTNKLRSLIFVSNFSLRLHESSVKLLIGILSWTRSFEALESIYHIGSFLRFESC